MNYIDIFIIAIFAWFAYKGFRKGLVFELISIVALGLGVYGGLKFSDVTAEYLTKYIDSEYLNVGSFSVAFLVILLLVFMAGKVVEKIIDRVALKLINKVLGAVFATIKMGIILGVIITIIDSYDQKMGFIPKEVKQESMLYQPLLETANAILPEIEKNNLYQKGKDTLFNKEEESNKD